MHTFSGNFDEARHSSGVAGAAFANALRLSPGAGEKIRVLEFLTMLAIGGTERHVVDLVHGIDSRRFDVRLACMRRWGGFLEDLPEREIAEYDAGSLWNYRSLVLRRSLARDIRRSGTHIVHTYGFYANVFAIPAARLAGAPVVVASIRDTGELLGAAQKRVHRWVCRLADCVLANAEGVRQWLIAEGYPQHRIRVIRNGIHLERFRRPAETGGLRREFGIPPDAAVIGVIARLERVKAIDVFLRAAAAIGSRFPKVWFVIVGDGTERQRLEREARRLGFGNRLVFAGFRRDVPSALADLSISVLPSLSEGLSNTLLESMAAGVPVIATRVGGTPEIVEDGHTGLLVPPADPDTLARAMLLLLTRPELAAEFGAAGQERVARRFSVERMVHETEALYAKLLTRKAAPSAAAKEPL